MRTSIANLDVQVLQTTPGVPRGAVVLCHGFGAPGDDLVGLHSTLLAHRPSLATVRFYFPAAPLTLDAEWGDSRAWWMIDLETIAKLQQGEAGALREFRNAEPAGLAQARKQLARLVDEVSRSTALSYGRLVLGGFSQGAMLTTDLALRLEEPPAGLAILSGTVLTEERWIAKAKGRAGLRVLQSHGRQDPLLPFSAAEALESLLSSAGIAVDFVAFDGGHGIPPTVVARLAEFLDERLG
jgi:phospholipase/carboxylesterase